MLLLFIKLFSVWVNANCFSKLVISIYGYMLLYPLFYKLVRFSSRSHLPGYTFLSSLSSVLSFLWFVSSAVSSSSDKYCRSSNWKTIFTIARWIICFCSRQLSVVRASSCLQMESPYSGCDIVGLLSLFLFICNYEMKWFMHVFKAAGSIINAYIFSVLNIWQFSPIFV